MYLIHYLICRIAPRCSHPLWPAAGVEVYPGHSWALYGSVCGRLLKTKWEVILSDVQYTFMAVKLNIEKFSCVLNILNVALWRRTTHHGTIPLSVPHSLNSYMLFLGALHFQNIYNWKAFCHILHLMKVIPEPHLNKTRKQSIHVSLHWLVLTKKVQNK